MQVVLVHQPQENVVLPGEMVSATVPLTDIHWEREAVLVVDMGEQRTGGYRVEVTGMNLAGGDEIHLDLQVTRPGPGSFVAQVFTHPYTVVRIPRIGLRPGEITVTGRDQGGAEVVRQVVPL